MRGMYYIFNSYLLFIKNKSVVSYIYIIYINKKDLYNRSFLFYSTDISLPLTTVLAPSNS